MDIGKLASLTKLSIDKREEGYFKKQFDETLKIVDEFKNLDTSKVSPTYSVTGTKNVMRNDEIDATRVLTQEEALANGKKTHNGYFIVDAILNGT